ncbi:YajG family lipoprotein [Leeia oryzae]|uniref:YajG family lipoprotein n=1 Tax=Leeia oryzae TaxID=356662 RepID=UPI000367B061|nr:YajG family lipoprotein [Leeia oryzae]
MHTPQTTSRFFRNTRKTLLAATIFAAVLGLSGCALTTDRIELSYTPQPGITPIEGANKVSVSVQVNDMRQDKTKVSSKKNGFGMEMAPILAIEDVTVTVRNAIEQELKARGFQPGNNTALVQILADLTRFYNDHKTGFFAGDAVADLNMSVLVKATDGKLLYSRQLMAQGLEPNIQLMTGNNARLALNRALENGMKSLFSDQAFITALLSASKTP